MILQPKNWSKFQHYKDRNPPWIKLHKDLLNDPDFMSLSSASVGLACMLWLLASETKDGCFDASTKHLTFRLRKTEREITAGLKQLIELGFFIIASTMQACDTESPSERETYKPEGEKKYKGDFESIWSRYPNKTGKTKAEERYKASVKSEIDDTAIHNALDIYLSHLEGEQWKKPQNGSTWFKDWRDWLEFSDSIKEEHNFV